LQSTLTSLATQPTSSSHTSNLTSSDDPRPGLFVNLFVIVVLAAGGIALGLWLSAIQLGNPDPRHWFNVFYVLFARNEPAGLAIVTAFASATIIWLGCGAPGISFPRLGRPELFIALVAAATLAICAFGTDFICHNYALTADENMADFQAQIFLRGTVTAEVPAQWRDAVYVIKPTFADYLPATHSWKATYLPVYAAIRAVFQSVGLQTLLNPLLGAVTVLALYGAARNIWPESKTNALVAISLLVSSSQFLLTSMTAYSMPAHLALNTIWLWLYSRPDRRRFYLTPFVGVLAIGLHQPIVHALFALPFLLRLVWQRRWGPVVIFGMVYFAGCALWFLWREHYQLQSQSGGVGSVFKFLNPSAPIIQSMNLLLIIAWASLATPLLAFLGAKQFFKGQPIVQDAILSCALTFIFDFFFYLDQAHGWGYRYFYGALSCFVFVAVAGFNRFSTLVGERSAQIFVLAGVAMSLFVQLPLRCWQAETFVRPYARTAAVIHAMHEDIVAVDPRDAWYSADLIRNDPFLEQRPVIVSLLGLSTAAVAALEKNGTTRFITRDELTRLGMHTSRPDDYRRGPFGLGRGK
jgi:hypothetical protein